jgi:hypothetical protein
MPLDLNITAYNQSTFRNVLNALEEGLEEMSRITDRFPIICVIDGQKFVFKCRSDIQELIDGIQAGLPGKT